MASHRKLKAGHFIFEFDTPGIGYILKHAGCDFTILDTEHSGFGIETVRRVMAFMRAAELPTIVRSPSRDYKDVARTLDAGADAVMLPMVSNADEAKSIIHSMKYFPTGGRGVILRSAVDRYTAGPTMEKLAAQNRRTMLVVQIENAEGVENAQAIGALEEVDCLWVGHFDLSCSLGIPGEFEHPKFIEAIDAVIEAGRATDTRSGAWCPTSIPASPSTSRARLHRLFGRCLGAGRCGGGGSVRDSNRLRRLRREPCSAFRGGAQRRFPQARRQPELRGVRSLAVAGTTPALRQSGPGGGAGRHPDPTWTPSRANPTSFA